MLIQCRFFYAAKIMKHHIGIALQLLVLAVLPTLILFQLQFRFRLMVMPVSLIIGIVIFAIGAKLREMK